MSVLWCGGEDIDFPNNAGLSIQSASAGYRTAYARCCLRSSTTTPGRSLVFPGGAVTSCWLSFQGFGGSTFFSATLIAGLAKDPTTAAGLYIGSNDAINTKLSLWKHDGVTTKTVLATETGASLGGGVVFRCDMQLISYGVAATVNVYINNVLVLTFTGDVTVSGVASLSAAAIGISGGGNSGASEIIVADEDPRGWVGLATMAPNGQGTTDDWNNTAYTNVNPVTINDANATYVNLTGLNEQYNLTDLLSGVYVVKAVKVAARSLSTTGAVANQLKLGFNSGGSVAGAAAHSPTTAFTTYEDYFATNPVTSAPWGNSVEMNALQVNLQS